MALALFKRITVLIRGGGDLASGVVYRLHRAGFPVVILELERPLLVRRTVSYGDAVYCGRQPVEGIIACRAGSIDQVKSILNSGEVPVLVDPEGAGICALNPIVLVDARMAKLNLGTKIDDALIVIGLGPGFVAGFDCHAVIETNRGHNLGRVIYKGSAEPDTGEPGKIAGMTHSRVLRSPAAGRVLPEAEIGDFIKEKRIIATVAGQPVVAPFDGVLRGLIHPDVDVKPGLKIGDLDPRAKREHCYTISDKSLAVGGGVLAAILSFPQLESYLSMSEHETATGV